MIILVKTSLHELRFNSREVKFLSHLNDSSLFDIYFGENGRQKIQLSQVWRKDDAESKLMKQLFIEKENPLKMLRYYLTK